jgi:hypothetical protein
VSQYAKTFIDCLVSADTAYVEENDVEIVLFETRQVFDIWPVLNLIFVTPEERKVRKFLVVDDDQAGALLDFLEGQGRPFVFS